MRADRLLSIMLLLQVNHRITARELAKRLEVSERTIHRDMEALSTAGVPVVAERGLGGGWMLLEEYSTNLTGLNDSEIQALFVSSPARLLADLGLGKASEAAFIKLLASLPVMNRRGAEYVRQRIYVDSAGWRRSEEAIPFLATIQDAIWQDRKLSLAYQRSDETNVERLVDPLGLVVKGSTWYLVSAVDGELRTYRVSRIQNASITDQLCARPKGFDLAAYWQQSSANFVANLPRYPVTVRVPPVTLTRMRYARGWARIEQVDAPDTDGWMRVFIQCEQDEDACEYILGFGPQIEVLEPRELREKVIRLAQEVVEFYAQRIYAPSIALAL